MPLVSTFIGNQDARDPSTDGNSESHEATAGARRANTHSPGETDNATDRQEDTAATAWNWVKTGPFRWGCRGSHTQAIWESLTHKIDRNLAALCMGETDSGSRSPCEKRSPPRGRRQVFCGPSRLTEQSGNTRLTNTLTGKTKPENAAPLQK